MPAHLNGSSTVPTSSASLLSVVFVTYNSADTIGAAIASVRRHLPDAEIVVVDNGSTDQTCRIAQESGATQLLDGHGNIGFGAGVNVGARAANGELLLVLNPDAAVVDAKVDQLSELMRRPSVGMLGCMLREGSRCRHLTYTEWGWRRELCWLMVQWFLVPREVSARRRSSHARKSRMWISGAAFIVCRAEFLSIGGFDEQIFLYFEDVDLSRRYREHGTGVGTTDAIVAVHEGQGSSHGRHEQIQGWALLSFIEVVTKWNRRRDGERAARAALRLLTAISIVGRIVGALPIGGRRAAAKARSAALVRSTFLGHLGAPPVAGVYPHARASVATVTRNRTEQDRTTADPPDTSRSAAAAAAGERRQKATSRSAVDRQSKVKETLDFIVIGAQKAGTTSLFEHLRQHPELSLPPGKEVPFFSHEAARARGWADYMRKAFAFAHPDTKWGTATPQYMVGGLWEEPNPLPSGEAHDERSVPLRIRERVPDTRLIAILRDPVQRARSHHRMAVMNQLDRRPFSQAIDELLRSDALELARREPRETTGYVVWGEYGRILTGYFDVFPRSQILVLFTSELESEPEKLLRRIYEFIDVDPSFLPTNVGVRYRVGGAERRLAWLGTHARSPWTVQRAFADNAAARRIWHALPEPRRRHIDHVFAHGARRLDLWNRRPGAADCDDEDGAMLQRLQAHYAQDADRLTRLLGAPPPWQR